MLSGFLAGTRKMETPLPARPYTPSHPNGSFPYTKSDLTPMDAGNDSHFYSSSRFVTHIDDNAINHLRQYYDTALPRKGRILDFCSSWISHYPPSIVDAGKSEDLVILGTGMNEAELKGNPVLKRYVVQDLNEDPEVGLPGPSPSTSTTEQRGLDASTCVVSIDYLTSPVQVLSSIRQQTNPGGKIHLIISNRCFPTKAVGRWLKVSEEQRLEMVGDYLWWSGWRNIEIQAIVQGGFMTDPLWVVRAENVGEEGGG
jgi:hypothetical protein